MPILESLISPLHNFKLAFTLNYPFIYLNNRLRSNCLAMFSALAVNFEITGLADVSRVKFSLGVGTLSCWFSATMCSVATAAKPMRIKSLVGVNALGCKFCCSGLIPPPCDLLTICTPVKCRSIIVVSLS